MINGDQVLFHLKCCLTALGLTEISLQNVHKLTVTRAETCSTVLIRVTMHLKLNLENNGISTISTAYVTHFLSKANGFPE